MRYWIRCIVAALVTLGVLALILSSSGRGFLPSYRRYLQIDLRTDASGRWSASLSKTSDEFEEASPPDSGVTRVSIQESSMGRTDAGGGWSMWRCTTFVVVDVLEDRGSVFHEQNDYEKLVPSEAREAVDALIVNSVAPVAPGVWRDRPRDLQRHENTWWIWQRRVSWSWIIAYFVFALSVGVGVASLVVPRRRPVAGETETEPT